MQWIRAWTRDVKGASEQQVALDVVFMNNYLHSIPLGVGAFFANGLVGCWHQSFTTWVFKWASRKDERVPKLNFQ